MEYQDCIANTILVSEECGNFETQLAQERARFLMVAYESLLFSNLPVGDNELALTRLKRACVIVENSFRSRRMEAKKLLKAAMVFSVRSVDSGGW